jgi:hypothetical protein
MGEPGGEDRHEDDAKPVPARLRLQRRLQREDEEGGGETESHSGMSVT